MQKETWIVVANSTHARFFKLDSHYKLVEMPGLVHVESRMHEGDVLEEKTGKNLSARWGSALYPTERQHTPKKVEAMTFAKQVADHIENARATGQIQKLFVAASPSFLGLLRQELSQQTLNLLQEEVPKDITLLNPENIRDYFPIGI